MHLGLCLYHLLKTQAMLSRTSCRSLLHPIRHHWLHIKHRLDQIINDFGPGLVTNLFDFIELLLCLLFGVFFGFFIA